MSDFHNKPHILVVDDDDRLRALLEKYLSEQGFVVTTARDVAEAEGRLAWFEFDLMVLDVMMPGQTGIDWLGTIKTPHPPTLMLSALGDAQDRIQGLEVGAEDYLGKPFEPKELVLRIKAILRRASERRSEKTQIKFGAFCFEPEAGLLKRGDEIISLTTSEAEMLKILASNAGKPVSREALVALLPEGSNERSVDVQITRLRKKIEESEGRPLYLQTVRGAGYVLYVG